MMTLLSLFCLRISGNTQYVMGSLEIAFWRTSPTFCYIEHFGEVHTTHNSHQICHGLIAWICGECKFKNEAREPRPCLMCQAPHPKYKAVVALPALAAAPAVASAPWPTHPMHPSGLVLDIVRLAVGDRGRRCEEHKVCCSKVVEEDIAVLLRKERILVPDYLANKGKMREETTITVNWVMDRIDRCHMRFLHRCLLLMALFTMVHFVR